MRLIISFVYKSLDITDLSQKSSLVCPALLTVTESSVDASGRLVSLASRLNAEASSDNINVSHHVGMVVGIITEISMVSASLPVV